jgi:D-alanine-D-alanine ligase
MELRKFRGAELEKFPSKPKVAVLMGGIGAEREISIQSGTCVADALKQADFEVITFDINPDSLEILEDRSINIFFPVLHGQFGEDGSLQQIIEDKMRLYAGSGPFVSRIAFDKMQSKKFFDANGIVTPGAIEFNSEVEVDNLRNLLSELGDKYVIKPIRQGSSVGVCIASSLEDAIEAAQKTLAQFGDCMIEEFIEGREITVGILCDKTLPIIEIRAQSGFYNYHAKYIDDQTEYLFDTIEDPNIVASINRAAIDCYEALGCQHFARVDFILSNENIPYTLEVNTIPGFTSHSLLPKAAARAGLSMSDLCEKIIETAYSPITEPQA